jgi:hypothetical protein
LRQWGLLAWNARFINISGSPLLLVGHRRFRFSGQQSPGKRSKITMADGFSRAENLVHPGELASIRVPRRRWPVPRVSRKLKPEERAILKAVESLCKEIDRLSASAVRHLQKRLPVPFSLFSRMQEASELLPKLIQFATPEVSALSTGKATAAAGVAILVKRRLLTKEEAEDVRKRALRRPRGHPEKIRHLAARAEGLKLHNPMLTWKALADRLRPKDFPVHAQPFNKRLRRDVVRLRALLRRIDTFLRKQPSAS